MHKIIFDTDPGIDDAMALAFLNAHPDAHLLALTTVFGNAPVEITTLNALYLTQRFGMDTPVYKGADRPLSAPKPRFAPHVHGADGMGDIGVTDGFRANPQPTPAHVRMAELIRAHPHEVTVLAVGPLTNLALALAHDPAIAGLVREVVVMGGAFGRNDRHGNATPFAEANIHNDPEAAIRVFNAPWPVRVIGLDVTLECILNATEAAQLKTLSDTGAFLWDISRQYEALYREDGFAGCALHDAAAAIAVMRPDLFVYETGTVSVTTKGPVRGQTLLSPRPAVSHSVATKVDAQALLDLFTQTLSNGFSTPQHAIVRGRSV